MKIHPVSKEFEEKIKGLISGAHITDIQWVERNYHDMDKPEGLRIIYSNGYKLYFKGGGCSGNDCNCVLLYDAEDVFVTSDEHEY